MNIKRKVFLSLLGIAILLVPQPGVVSADSNSDDVYHTLASLTVPANASCPSTDVTYSWQSYITDSSTWKNGPSDPNMIAISNAFDEALESGSIAVSQRAPYYSIDIIFSPDSKMNLQWESGGVYAVTPATGTVYLVGLGCSDNYSSPYIGYGFTNSLPVGQYPTQEPITISNINDTVFGFDMKNFIFTGNISYPDNYAGLSIRSEYPSARYVAMGDSYSSGEGNPAYESGTDTNANTCHRSHQAYPRLVQASLELGATRYAACSGAVSDYIINNYNQENVVPPQATYMSEDTEIATITIGGNDIGFGDTISTCVASTTAQDCLDAISVASSKASDPNLLTDITSVLSGIKALGGQDTQVIAIGYPRLYPEHENISGSCTWGNPNLALLTDKVSGRTITESEIDALKNVHDDLNGVIASAVANTSNPDIHFVDPTNTFEGHEICGVSDDWLHEVFLHPSTAELQVGSFHPNNAGQAAYASLIEGVIQGLN